MHDLSQVQPPPLDPALAGALACAAGAFARLDQALAGHPLLPAFFHRARLDAVRRQATVDGQAIDPWHLAAVLEGFRLRMDGALRIIDRGAILAAARHALDLHQWLVAPDFDQEGAVRQAERVLAAAAASGATPLLAAATGLHAWLGGDGHGDGNGNGSSDGDGHGGGGSRPPMRAALMRFWMTQHLLRALVPLTGDRALRPDTPWQRDTWMPAFLMALARRGGGRARSAGRPGARLARRTPRRDRPDGGIRVPPPQWISWRLRRWFHRRTRHGGEQRHAVAR